MKKFEEVVEVENKVTFIQRVEKFMVAKEISTRPKTLQNYSISLRTHSKPLYDKYIDDITRDYVQKIIADMRNYSAIDVLIETV